MYKFNVGDIVDYVGQNPECGGTITSRWQNGLVNMYDVKWTNFFHSYEETYLRSASKVSPKVWPPAKFKSRDMVDKSDGTKLGGIILSSQLSPLNGWVYAVDWPDGTTSGYEEHELVLFRSQPNPMITGSIFSGTNILTTGGYSNPFYYSMVGGGGGSEKKDPGFAFTKAICECGKEKHGFANHVYWCDVAKLEK